MCYLGLGGVLMGLFIWSLLSEMHVCGLAEGGSLSIKSVSPSSVSSIFSTNREIHIFCLVMDITMQSLGSAWLGNILN